MIHVLSTKFEDYFHMATAASFSYETKKLKPAVFVFTEISDYQKLILIQRRQTHNMMKK